MKRSKKIALNVALIVFFAGAFLVTTKCLGVFGKYAFLSYNLQTIEKEGNRTSYVAGKGENGENYVVTNGWSVNPGLQSTWEEAKAAKESFISESFIAQFISKSAKTVIGRIARIIIGVILSINWMVCFKALGSLLIDDLKFIFRNPRI